MTHVWIVVELDDRGLAVIRSVHATPTGAKAAKEALERQIKGTGSHVFIDRRPVAG